jgi:TfoX/Sxy family transcriptional regulator of competence genes
MAYNEQLAERIEQLLEEKKISYFSKKMFGGLCFMVEDKMCLGIVKEELMARIGPDGYQEALQKAYCKEMNFTGRAMKGYVYIEPDGLDMDEDLEYWLQRCLDFNPLAKASKKKKPKKK